MLESVHPPLEAATTTTAAAIVSILLLLLPPDLLDRQDAASFFRQFRARLLYKIEKKMMMMNTFIKRFCFAFNPCWLHENSVQEFACLLLHESPPFHIPHKLSDSSTKQQSFEYGKKIGVCSKFILFCPVARLLFFPPIPIVVHHFQPTVYTSPLAISLPFFFTPAG